METWILYSKPDYDALPWPFAGGWDDFLRSPQPLPGACGDFAAVSPCDGLSETPNVPPHLPRALPRAACNFAIYHDREWLYIFLEAADPEPLTAPAVLLAGPQLAGENLFSRAVTVFSGDRRRLYRFAHDRHDRPLATVNAVAYGSPGKSAEPLPAWAPAWDFQVTRSATGAELACWRIARTALADAWNGNELRLSVSRAAFAAIETVAWGANHIWAPRPDEAGLVRLIEECQTPPWPELERLDMVYNPETETAEFACRWSALPPPAPAVFEPRGKGFPPRPIAWNACALRVGSALAVQPLAASVRIPPMPIPDGISRIQAASAAGPATTVFLEKCSGRRLHLPDWLDAMEVPEDGLRAWPAALAAECAALLEQAGNSGATPEYTAWCAYRAASIGRAWQHFLPEPRLLDWFRQQADFLLTLQRPDGTFAGNHQCRPGAPAPRAWQGGAYDSGQAGELFALAAGILGDAKYLAASERLLHAYAGYRVELNHNFAAFALYHLAEHYRLTGDPLALEHGLYYCQTAAAANILPLGFQAGHNYYTCYGSITLRGLCHFCAVLPAEHPWRPILRERCLRMGNQLLSRLQPDGLFDSRDRYFIGERQWSFGLFSLAQVAGAKNGAALGKAVRFILHAALAAPGSGERPQPAWGRFCGSDLILYMATDAAECVAPDNYETVNKYRRAGIGDITFSTAAAG